MRLESRCIFYPKPIEPNGYICSHDISVICASDGGGDREVVAARLAVDFLDIARIEEERVNVREVCDAESQEWHNVCSAMIEPGSDYTDLRKEFEIDCPVFGLVFIHQAVFHPSMLDWQRMIVESVSKLFPTETATVMWKRTTGMTDRELASLGFRIVAGQDLLFRPNMLRSEYETANDDRDPNFDLKVPSDAAAYVQQEWDREDRSDFDVD
ncbi:hypothetical protein [Rhodopirellula sp. SWK7]|uniref:hypothetical protein n=1 Tax=Rhodopirellula sp. SWK7 TaxID=595460 RepID=UPI0002BE947B|nr:hypothetical protein [Rhodopirellula sp. SWK7]EMI40842.1 hypothetical protein RRSWK_06665 [Rhodopirellula sp. SWK7]